MPSALGERHKLDDCAITPNEKMRGYLYAANFSEVRVRVPIECIGKQGLDFRSTKLTGWKTNPVNNDHGRIAGVWSRIAIRAGTQRRRFQQTSGFVDSELA